MCICYCVDCTEGCRSFIGCWQIPGNISHFLAFWHVVDAFVEMFRVASLVMVVFLSSTCFGKADFIYDDPDEFEFEPAAPAEDGSEYDNIGQDKNDAGDGDEYHEWRYDTPDKEGADKQVRNPPHSPQYPQTYAL